MRRPPQGGLFVYAVNIIIITAATSPTCEAAKTGDLIVWRSSFAGDAECASRATVSSYLLSAAASLAGGGLGAQVSMRIFS
jgi:hypothetical protein